MKKYNKAFKFRLPFWGRFDKTPCFRHIVSYNCGYLYPLIMDEIQCNLQNKNLFHNIEQLKNTFLCPFPLFSRVNTQAIHKSLTYIYRHTQQHCYVFPQSHIRTLAELEPRFLFLRWMRCAMSIATQNSQI
jgi:hypothetical protein